MITPSQFIINKETCDPSKLKMSVHQESYFLPLIDINQVRMLRDPDPAKDGTLQINTMFRIQDTFRIIISHQGRLVHKKNVDLATECKFFFDLNKVYYLNARIKVSKTQTNTL